MSTAILTHSNQEATRVRIVERILATGPPKGGYTWIFEYSNHMSFEPGLRLIFASSSGVKSLIPI